MRVDFYGGVERGDLALVKGEVRLCEVAEVDCASAVARELMSGCATDAAGGIGAYDSNIFVLAQVIQCAPAACSSSREQSLSSRSEDGIRTGNDNNFAFHASTQ